MTSSKNTNDYPQLQITCMYFVPFSVILYTPRQTRIIYSFFSRYRSLLSNLVLVAKEWQVVKTFLSSTVHRTSPLLRAARITLSIMSCSSLRRLTTASPPQASGDVFFRTVNRFLQPIRFLPSMFRFPPTCKVSKRSEQVSRFRQATVPAASPYTPI
jgi:hypothetical protein